MIDFFDLWKISTDDIEICVKIPKVVKYFAKVKYNYKSKIKKEHDNYRKYTEWDDDINVIIYSYLAIDTIIYYDKTQGL